MVTRAIKPKRDDMAPAAWQTIPEKAPSVVIESKPTFTRIVAAVGLLLTAIGVLALLAPVWKFPYMVGTGWGMVWLSLGVTLLLLHALTDKEEQFRRVYGMVSLLVLFVLVGGSGLRYLPFGPKTASWFLSLSIPSFSVLLLFLGAVLRHETQGPWRVLLTRALLGVAGLMIFGGIVNVNLFRGEFVAEGSLTLILGLAYAMVAINYLPESQAHGASLGLGAVGLFCVIEGVARSMVTSNFLVPAGFILIVLGLIYFAVSLGILSDLPFVVLTRRELASFFYSPIAYPVFLGLTVISLLGFFDFVRVIVRYGPMGVLFEPIVSHYAFSLVPVVAQLFVVPILTMRLLSEEQRTGTLEVLLTAPVNEPTVVLSKFFAALMFYMVMWLPWWLYLVSLRIVGGEEFDYRPLLIFVLALLSTGAGFISMGLFFSSVTRNQIIAAVLTFVGMMGHLSTLLLPGMLRLQDGSTEAEIFKYISFLNLWQTSLSGLLAPRYLLFHISTTVFFLFLAIKVLESRKWK